MHQTPAPVMDRDEHLVAELHQLGVRHLIRRRLDITRVSILPAQLLAELAAHPQARMRAALILLFLRRPSFSQCVFQALAALPAHSANTLRLYYQAAVYLRLELEDDLQHFSDDRALLPDLFSGQLGLPTPQTIASANDALERLGALQERLSGWAYNWCGSYRQNIGLFRRQLRRYADESSAT